MKLVVAEPESGPLRAVLAERGGRRVSSAIARVEVVRATLLGAPAAVPVARAVLDALDEIPIDRGLLDDAADLPVAVRTLDALHLAAARRIAAHLDGFVTYDRRLGAAAASLGFDVLAPG